VTSGPPVIIETSGSSGQSKRVVLSREAVIASAEATAARIGTGQWWLTLPSSYVAGMMVIVRSLLAGQDPIAGFRRNYQEETRFASLVPTQLHRLLEADPAHLRSFEKILVGGGPLDPELRARAAAAQVPIMATYGASETAGGCVYDGLPLDGVFVRIQDDGRIAIASRTLFDRYEGDPALTAATLVDGWYLTSDLGRFENGRLQVLGRTDDMVISGGVNVPTRAVAARLREHPRIEQVEVLGVPHEEWGQVVVAFLVGSITREEARDWVSTVHPRTWAPYEIYELEELPLLENGKVDRQRLRGLFQ
jgi:O-succinylbenzoic acid--CoA ligase